MDRMYTTGEAAQLAAISGASVRSLLAAAPYAGMWSPGATPPPGEARQIAAEDVRMLAYIRSRTRAGFTHDAIAQELHAGALDAFTWSIPAPEPESPPPAQDAAPIVLYAGMLERPLSEARSREDAWIERAISAESARAAAEARADALAAQVADLRRPWWARLFRP